MNGESLVAVIDRLSELYGEVENGGPDPKKLLQQIQ